jgi:hypothetical protein
MVQLAKRITEEPDIDYWETEGLCPKLEPAADGYRYEISMVDAPEEHDNAGNAGAGPGDHGTDEALHASHGRCWRWTIFRRRADWQEG